MFLNFPPGYSRLHSDFFVLFRKSNDLVEIPHVDMQSAFGCGLASHAEPSATNGNRSRVRDDRTDNLVETRWGNNALDSNRIELSNVVDCFWDLGRQKAWREQNYAYTEDSKQETSLSTKHLHSPLADTGARPVCRF